MSFTIQPADLIKTEPKKNKTKFYRGSEQNVLKRVIDTAKHFKCKTIVRVTSDCPIIDTNIIDQAVQMFKFNECDYLSNALIRSSPNDTASTVRELSSGSDVIVISERSNWSYVEAPDNLRGWIRKDYITKTWPYEMNLIP